jgi:fimbrial chaperone protein
MTPRTRLLPRKLFVAVLAFAWFAVPMVCAAPLHAGNFEIKPLRVSLSSDRTTEILTVSNSASTTLRLELTPYAWQQTPTEEFKLIPTEDLIVFPPLLEVDPHSDGIIRIGTETPFGFAEKPYRLMLEEMPGAQSAPKPGAVKGVSVEVVVLNKITVPIFMEPAQMQYGESLGQLSFHDGKLVVPVQNGGANVHILTTVEIAGFDAANKKVYAKASKPYYVLAGGLWDCALEIPTAECRQIRKLGVKVKISRPVGWLESKDEELDAELATTPDQCAAEVAKKTTKNASEPVPKLAPADLPGASKRR